jgi:hypothetical protein
MTPRAKNNTMKTWLKLIGSAKSPITEWEKDYVGFRKTGKPSIRTGDHMFLYAPGGRRIFALAEAVSDPERDPNYNPNEHGSCRWRLDVHYLFNFPVASGILVSDISSKRDLTKSISQKSHVRLLPEESQSARGKLEEHIRVVDSDSSPVVFPDEIDAPDTYWEGASRRVTVNSYERDPAARRACIAHFGTACKACNFDFSTIYGELGKDFTHVHHTRPLSEVRAGYTVDPLCDLIPVCPNCHAMLHKTSPPLTIAQLQERLHDAIKSA